MNESSREAAAVDPVEPEKVLWEAKQIGADLKFVLTTHHHWFVQTLIFRSLGWFPTILGHKAWFLF